MSEMVDRVARALCIADGKDPDGDWRIGPVVMLDVAVKDSYAPRWHLYSNAARAALAAMRVPTDNALLAGGNAIISTDHETTAVDMAYDCWHAMIDEMLK